MFEFPTNHKSVPTSILHADFDVRMSFLKGYVCVDCYLSSFSNTESSMILHVEYKITAASLYFLVVSLFYKCIIDWHLGKYRLIIDVNPTSVAGRQWDSTNIVRKIELIGRCDEYVYDLETGNHHFGAGIGRMIVHNTDSVMVQFPLPVEIKTEQETYDYYYDLCTRLAKLGTSMFPSPNLLQFESMKRLFLLLKKKLYAAMEYPGNTWKVEPKRTVKGLSYKKRDRCPFVRRVGDKVLDFIMKQQSGEILSYLSVQFGLLVNGNIGYKDLAITCLLQDEVSYKNENLIQLETARNISLRNGSCVESGSRLSYVVLAGNKPLYQRGEDPDFAEKNELKLDFLYYLDKQLLSTLEQLLTWHNIDLSALVKLSRQTVDRRTSGVRSLVSMIKRHKSNDVACI